MDEKSENTSLHTSSINLEKSEEERPEWFEYSLNNPRWAIPVVKLAMAEKKESRNSRGAQFNCFVLTKPGNEYESNEYVEFLDLLAKNIDSFTDTTRFQVALFTADNCHWTAFDFLIVDGKIHVFCLDAANDSSADVALDEIMKKFPDCDAYRLEPDKDPKAKDARHLRIIQTDRESCSRMTIEHIFLLSKRNFLFNENFKEYRKENGVKLINPDTLFRNAPELYRVTQVRSILDSLVATSPKDAKKLVSKKGLDLKSYIELHGIDESAKSKNKTIDYKKQNIKEKVEGFFVKYGGEHIQKILKSSEEQWSEFLTLPASAKVEFLLGGIRDKTFKDIAKNIVAKNLQDSSDSKKYIDHEVIKKSTGFFKGVNQYFEVKKIKENIKKLDNALGIINKLSSESSPDEVILSLKNLKLPSTVLEELETARQVYSQLGIKESIGYDDVNLSRL